MENIIILVHLLMAVSIVGLILLQQGKGAEMGASFGSGASQTLFGSGGSGNFFSKMTAVCAFAFFVTSFSLAVIAKQNAGIDTDLPPTLIDIPAESLPEVQQDDSDMPVVEEAQSEEGVSDIPEVPEQ